jgi:YD repeat-containing protein
VSEVTTFVSDALVRPVTQTYDDGETIVYGWDAMSNLTQLTPPGRAAHMQSFDSIGQQTSYAPPEDSGGSSGAMIIGYDRDRQPTLITRPDGTSLAFGYDTAGRLASLATPRGSYVLSYYDNVPCVGCVPGELKSLTSPYGVTITSTFDGSLLRSFTWSGPSRVQLASTMTPISASRPNP